MNPVLESIRSVIEQAEHVRINQRDLESFCATLESPEPQFTHPFRSVKLSPDERIQFSLVYNGVNFCFWGNPKWTIVHQDREISGAYGMKAALHRALEDGRPLLDASYLAKMTEAELAQITRGNIQIPLLTERVRILREIGATLNANYKDNAMELANATGGDTMELLSRVTKDFPSYDDSATYRGRKVRFDKRAQLFVGDVGEVMEKQGRNILGREQLTAFADYKVPQILREVGILEYTSELADLVDGCQEIPSGSPEEIEIRAFTIESVERMTKVLRPRFPGITARDVDWLLYVEAKKLPKETTRPHHRTVTTAY